MWLTRNHSRIALDIGPVTVSACQMQRIAGDRSALRRWGHVEDPLRDRPLVQASSLARQGILSDPDAPPAILADRTGRLVAQLGFRGRGVILALKPPDVNVATVTLPEAILAAPREHLHTAMAFEAARELNLDPKSLVVDGWRLPPQNRSGHNLMLCAAQRAVVERWSALAGSIGLSVERVEVAPAALLRVAWHNHAPRIGSDRVWGVLDLGFAATVVALARGPDCIFIRKLAVTGDTLTLAILDALGVDYATAEILKREGNFASAEPNRARQEAGSPESASSPTSPLPRGRGSDQSPLADGRGSASQAVQNVVRLRLKALAAEIERAFAYVMESYPDLSPGTLFLAGGGSKLNGLVQELGTHLGIDVAALDPCAALAPAKGTPSVAAEQRPSVAAAIGMALGDLV